MSKLLAVLILLYGLPAFAKELVIGNVDGNEIVGEAEDRWHINARPGPASSVATVRLSRGDAPDVVVLLTVLRPVAGSPLSGGDAETIFRMVAASATQVSAQSVEGTLNTESFAAGRVQGAYFSATDKAPPPGEFKYMSQGIASLEDLVVTFTALSHDDPKEARASMLKILGSLHVRHGD